MSVLYSISVEQLPGGGIGSPNQAFTLAVLVVTVAMAAPFLVLLRRRAAGVVAIGLGFTGVFGWLPPFLCRVIFELRRKRERLRSRPVDRLECQPLES